VPEGQTSGEPATDEGEPAVAAEAAPVPDQAGPETGGRPSVQATAAAPQIINLLRVPGVHQVMLQVQIAELNRTALRQVGADWTWGFGAGNVLQTFIGGGPSTVTGVFPTADLNLALRVLRDNLMLSVLAEPNLVALSGQTANFLAGGEFPVPVPQNAGGGTTITVEFKQFGVQLEFLPYVLEDETIRLSVNSEESSPDKNNAIEISGYFVPGINTRRASTTVEMRQGQSLAIAGLLRVSIDANTKRIPGLGDLPYIGPLFSNTTHARIEKELVILVTPSLVAPMNPEDVPCLPTDGITDPNDLEFYLLNRLEGRTGRAFSSARNWDDPWHLRQLIHLEQRCISGPIGLSPLE
jgi:pilus assembly protein CpaC